jgi:hypothetical protein
MFLISISNRCETNTPVLDAVWRKVSRTCSWYNFVLADYYSRIIIAFANQKPTYGTVSAVGIDVNDCCRVLR